MRGLRSIATGQRLLEGIEAIQAIRRGDLLATPGTLPMAASGAVRARAEAAALRRLADELRHAA
jgi:hypothetical protein